MSGFEVVSGLVVPVVVVVGVGSGLAATLLSNRFNRRVDRVRRENEVLPYMRNLLEYYREMSYSLEYYGEPGASQRLRDATAEMQPYWHELPDEVRRAWDSIPPESDMRELDTYWDKVIPIIAAECERRIKWVKRNS